MKIGIIGMGLLGITYSSILSDSEIDVVGVDQDEETIAMLHEGELPVYEPGLRPLMMASVASGRLKFTSNLAKTIKESDIIFITCDVPVDEKDMPNLRFVKTIIQSIGNHMEDHLTIVVKSTSPPGTCKMIEATIKRILAERDRVIPFDVVSNPDFARKGVMIKDCLIPDMVVIGSESDQAIEKLKALYDRLSVRDENFVITNPQSAEMIKYGVNAFLAIKLSFINEMALICENADANILDVAKGIGKDFRIGHAYLNAGPGFGGSDLPKDSKALIGIAEAYGQDLSVLKGAMEANEKQKQKILEKIIRTMGGVDQKVIGLLGLSYKAKTNDMRESPALTIVKGLVAAGARVQIYCPEGIIEGKWRLHKEKDALTYCQDMYQVATGADALIITTAWREFNDMDHGRIREAMRDRYFFDFRNIFGKKPPKGFIYSGLGLAMKEGDDDEG